MKGVLKYFCSVFFSATCIIVTAQTFSGTFNQIIPDAGPPVSFNIPVSGLPSVIDSTFGVEKVCLNITHTWDADLAVSLKAPDGQTVLLFSGVGGSGDDFTLTCLKDSGNNIGTASAPFTGTFRPQSWLGDVNNNQNPNGTWTLICQDNAGQDQGTLIDWSITFSNQPAHPFSFGSSNLPIIIMNTNNIDIPNDVKVQSSFEVIDNGPGQRNYTNQTNYAFDGNILVELQGFSGPYYPKKNFDFDLIDTGGNKIDTSLLGMPSENDWILKAEYLDMSLIKNSLTYEFARRMGVYAPRTKYCEVVLNGKYIGVYSLTEKVKQSSHRLNISNLSPSDTSGTNLTGGYIIEMNINGDPADWTSAYLPSNTATSPYNVEFKHVDPKSSNIMPQQHDYIKSWVDSFENALNGNNFQDTINGFRKWANEFSFMDFCIVNEFSTNYDSYGRSTYLFKNKSTHNDSLLHIGPPWDYDRAYNSTTGWVYEITHPLWPFPFWWMKFQQDSLYTDRFFCRYFSYRQEVLNLDSMLNYIDSCASLLQEGAQRNFMRWGELGVTNYNDQVTTLKNNVTQRLAWMDANITSNFLNLPFLTLNDTVICEGSSVTIVPQPGLSYEWSNGTLGNTSVITQPGLYDVEVENAWGCKTHNRFNVDFIPGPDASFQTNLQGGFMYNFLPFDTSQSTYYWNFGDGTFSNQIHPTHYFMQAGLNVVSLTVTSANTCSSTSIDSVYAYPLSVNDEPVIDFNLFPNPATDNVVIQILNSANGELIITNNLGEQMMEQKISSQPQIEIPTQNWPRGIYLVQFTDENGMLKRMKLTLM